MVIQLLTVLLRAAFLFKLTQLLRAPDDRPLRAVTLGLASATVAFTVGREPVEGLLHGLALGVPTLVPNLGMIGACSAITAFFVHATQPPQAAVRAMRRHTAILLGIAAATTVLWILMPTAARLDPLHRRRSAAAAQLARAADPAPQTARALGTSAEWVAAAISSGELPAKRLGGDWRVLRRGLPR